MKFGVRFLCVALVVAPTLAGAQTDKTVPVFLETSRDLLNVDGAQLKFVSHQSKGTVEIFQYASSDQVESLNISYVRCDDEHCRAILEQAIEATNRVASESLGTFLRVDQTEFIAEWKGGNGDDQSATFRTPDSVIFWTHNTRLERPPPPTSYFTRLQHAIDAQRFHEAAASGVLEIGRWDSALAGHARTLIAAHHNSDALEVLRAVIGASPSDYEALMDLAAIDDNRTEALSAAKAVSDNAEDQSLAARAARMLKIKEHVLADYPLLESGLTGLQVVLVPISPCDLRVVSEAAALYQKMTNIPVKIRRLRTAINFGSPDRVPNQKAVQEFLVSHMGPNTDFTGWKAPRYKVALQSVSTRLDAYTRFVAAQYSRAIDTDPPQYFAGFYLPEISYALSPVKSNDPRTMYVAITQANIYSGTANYVYAVGMPDQPISFMSYSMMTARMLNDPIQSRQRLAERIAKQLAPATLLSLGITRPLDPTDPLSFADGINRVDEKRLELSPATKKEIDWYRH